MGQFTRKKGRVSKLMWIEQQQVSQLGHHSPGIVSNLRALHGSRPRKKCCSAVRKTSLVWDLQRSHMYTLLVGAAEMPQASCLFIVLFFTSVC